eukprot:GHVR01036357.1.p1 GENE.GHVR01036357.1~~GHVR01036357.1.p1  ORF type:complete len:115 (+),score=41.09 GHVR01036357.1:61-405(+)
MQSFGNDNDEMMSGLGKQPSSADVDEERRRQQEEMNRMKGVPRSIYVADEREGYDGPVDIKKVEGYDERRMYGYMPSGDWTAPFSTTDVDDTIIDVRDRMFDVLTSEARFEMTI